MRRKARVTGNALDAVIQIISLAIVQNKHATKIKRPLLEVLEATAKMKPKTKLTMKLVSWLNSQMRNTQVKFVKFDKSANSLKEMLNNQKPSSCKIGLGFDSSKASISGTKLMDFVGSSVEKATDRSTIKAHGSTIHRSRGVTASVRKTRSSFDTNITPPTAAVGLRQTTSKKGKQATKASKAKSLSSLSEVAMTEAQQLKLVTKKSLQQTHISQESGSGADEGTSSIPWVLDVPTDESEEDLFWNSTAEEGDDYEGKDGDGDEDDDDDDQEVKMDDEKDDEEEGNGKEDLSLNIGREEGHDEEEEEDELYRDANINQGRGIQMTQEVEESHVTLTLVNHDGQQQSSSVSSQFTPTFVALLPMSVPTIIPSTIATVSTIRHAPTLPITAPSTLLQDLPNFGSLFGFDNRLRTLEANFSEFMQTNQFVRAVFAIPGIVHRYIDQRMNEAVQVAIQLQSNKLREEAQKENDEFLKTIDENTVNEQLEAEVLTRSSNSSKTSYVVVADLSEMELKKILIEKMEGNKSIQRSNEQMNLYKALVEAYESNKIILDAYEDTVTLKRRRDDDADKDEEQSVGPNRGMSASESATAEEPMQTTFEMEKPAHPEFEIVDTLTPKLIAGPTYELLKGSCKSLVELEYHLEEVYKATTDQLDWVNPE
nr:hypothetical protein [Tanacetum cinerariifolium]